MNSRITVLNWLSKDKFVLAKIPLLFRVHCDFTPTFNSISLFCNKINKKQKNPSQKDQKIIIPLLHPLLYWFLSPVLQLKPSVPRVLPYSCSRTKTLVCRVWATREAVAPSAVRAGPWEATPSVPRSQGHERHGAPCSAGGYRRLPSRIQRVAWPVMQPQAHRANAWDDSCVGR